MNNEQELAEWVNEQMKKTETFAEKQARIKAIADKVNKAIGMEDFPYWAEIETTKINNHDRKSTHPPTDAADQKISRR